MEECLYSVMEVSKILKINQNFVYKLIACGLLPALKLGRYKVRSSSLQSFMAEYEGKDLTDLSNIKELNIKGDTKDEDNK